MSQPKIMPKTGVAEVDELGVLLAQLVPLQRRERELKETLKSYNHPVLEGAIFRCTVSEHLDERLDSKAIRAEMGDTWFSAHAKLGVKQTVRVAGKTAS